MLRHGLLHVLLGLVCLPQLLAQPLQVRIRPETTGYALLVNGKPYYINGFVGASQFGLASEYGANSVRTYGGKEPLDEAARHGLTALVGLHLPGERDGMDWNDEARKARLRTDLLATVRALKDHPAVLMWALGNELDWIPPGKPYNRQLWTFLNELARSIHQIDPNHPVMTVVGTSEMPQKFTELARLCPDLDVLGLNAYADLPEVCAQAREHWKRPFVVTEWGPDGHWEVKKTNWKVPLEQTSTEKAQSYRTRYRDAIVRNKAYCLGSYVFYWHHKQEITHTWYGMFDKDGNATETAEAMSECWRGRLPVNRAPKLLSFSLPDYPNRQDIRPVAGRPVTVNVAFNDPDNDPLTLAWEIREEATYASYAGQGEQEARTVAKQTLPQPATTFQVPAPTAPGAYRLFVYLYDGKKHQAVGNLPFKVGE